jgi:hypothetical protein
MLVFYSYNQISFGELYSPRVFNLFSYLDMHKHAYTCKYKKMGKVVAGLN